MNNPLLKHLKVISIPRHPIWDSFNHQRVREYICEQLEQYGTVEKQYFPSQQVEGCNLILKLAGENPNLPPILVGAHYDGVPGTKAADDNATGVVALLILAASFAKNQARHPIWIVAFDQEEWGMIGGAALATTLGQQGQALELMLSLEMLGYTSETQSYPLPEMETIFGVKGDYIALLGNIESLEKLKKLTNPLAEYVPTKFLPVTDRGYSLSVTRLSDHSPFWDAGYDAVMVTDTAFLRNPHYHQPSDTLETLDLVFLEAVIQGLEKALRYF
jgi:Zn-dependent M28 family amino/carboxypeptidase